jgi:DNA repair photolyase
MPKIIGTEIIVSPLTESDLNKKSLCDYIINVAKGCLHGCHFCYVPSTPVIRMNEKELQSRGVENPQLDWGDYLFTREDVPEKLDAILARKRTWRETPSGRGVVLLCSGTDPYQNKQVAQVTRRTIEVLLKHKKRVRILTRSPLWVSDLDILVHPNVTVGMSLPHLDDQLSREVEPYAPLPSDRLKALFKGREAGCRLYLAMAPTVPFHTFSNFSAYFKTVAPLNPEVVFWEPINARGSNGQRMALAGLEWASEFGVRSRWAENFVRQWKDVEEAAKLWDLSDKLHIWADKELTKCQINGFNTEELCKPWFNRPTVEVWENAQKF